MRTCELDVHTGWVQKIFFYLDDKVHLLLQYRCALNLQLMIIFLNALFIEKCREIYGKISFMT